MQIFTINIISIYYYFFIDNCSEKSPDNISERIHNSQEKTSYTNDFHGQLSHIIHQRTILHVKNTVIYIGK